MSARNDILASIRSRTRAAAPKPDPYRAPAISSNLVAAFVAKAEAANTEVRILERENEIPTAITEILRAYNLAARISSAPEQRRRRIGRAHHPARSTGAGRHGGDARAVGHRRDRNAGAASAQYVAQRHGISGRASKSRFSKPPISLRISRTRFKNWKHSRFRRPSI